MEGEITGRGSKDREASVGKITYMDAGITASYGRASAGEADSE